MNRRKATFVSNEFFAERITARHLSLILPDHDYSEVPDRSYGATGNATNSGCMWCT
jgi:hypothetical protein